VLDCWAAAAPQVGKNTDIEVDIIIGADGANSRVAKEIGAGEYDYAIAFQVRYLARQMHMAHVTTTAVDRCRAAHQAEACGSAHHLQASLCMHPAGCCLAQPEPSRWSLPMLAISGTHVIPKSGAHSTRHEVPFFELLSQGPTAA